MPSAAAYFSAQLKPVGAACNLRCEYCYYRPEARGAGRAEWMAEETVEEALRQYIVQPAHDLTVGWHGGEPLLRGIDFFEHAFAFAESVSGDSKRLGHALQTNGVLVNDAWAELLARHGVLVGVSLDGTAECHDSVRRNVGGGPSADGATRAIRLLLEAGVDVNALCVVSRANVGRPVETYEALLRTGVRHIQFIPCWVQSAGAPRRAHTPKVGDYGRFLTRAFDLWAERHIGEVFVQNFEQALAASIGRPPDLCILAPSCENNLVVEYDGAVYACDWFVQPKWRLGNLHETPISELVSSSRQQQFAAQKGRLPTACHECRWLLRCNGGCPTHRPHTEAPRPTWFCRDYKILFEHAEPTLRRIGTELGLRPSPTV